MTEHRTMKKKNGGNAMNIFGMPSKSKKALWETLRNDPKERRSLEKLWGVKTNRYYIYILQKYV